MQTTLERLEQASTYRPLTDVEVRTFVRLQMPSQTPEARRARYAAKAEELRAKGRERYASDPEHRARCRANNKASWLRRTGRL